MNISEHTRWPFFGMYKGGEKANTCPGHWYETRKRKWYLRLL